MDLTYRRQWMSITNIKRDWGVQPCIVRITSTDTLATCGLTGYLLAQSANIQQINNGVFDWVTSDYVLVQASDGWAYFSVSSDFNSLNAAVANAVTGLTAHAGGGQTDALLLINKVNMVSTVATTGDSVKLPVAVPGAEIVVINASGNDMDLFPSSGGYINALSVDTALSIPDGMTIVLYCALAGTWNGVLSA